MSDAFGGGSAPAGSNGYIYSFGIHMGLGRGPVDEVVAARVGGKLAWQGSVTDNGVVIVNNPNLFGGLKKEGGIVGGFTVMMGGPSQVPSDLLKQLCAPARTPGFRGTLTIHYDGQISAVNPYPKPWAWRVRRAIKGWDGDPFQPSLAVIPLEGNVVPPTAGSPAALAYAEDRQPVPIGHPTLWRLSPHNPPHPLGSAITELDTMLSGTIETTIISIPFEVTYNSDGSATIKTPAQYPDNTISPGSGLITYPGGGYSSLNFCDFIRQPFPNPVRVHVVPPGVGSVFVQPNNIYYNSNPVEILGYQQLSDGSGTIDLAPYLFGKDVQVNYDYAPAGLSVTSRTDQFNVSDANQPVRLVVQAPNGGTFVSIEAVTTVSDTVGGSDFVSQPVAFIDRGQDPDDKTKGIVDILDPNAEGGKVAIGFAYRPNLGGNVIIPDGNIQAMNPAHIIYECLTNRIWGRGYDRALINDASFLAAAQTLYNEGFGLCLRWSRRDAIDTFIQNVLDHVAGTLYTDRSTALLTFKLIRGNYNKASLKLWDTSNGILEITDSAVNTSTVIVNEIIVKYKDPIYNEERSVNEQNLASLQSSGGAFNTITKQYPGIPIPSLARRVALRDLKAQAEGLRKFKLVVDRRGWNITPGDVMRIQDIPRSIPDMVVRVARAEDGTLTNGKITLDVVQDVFTMPAQSFTQDQPNTWLPLDSTPCVGQHVAFELPYYLVARNARPADFAQLTDTSAFMGVVAELGQPLNVNYDIAVRDAAPSPDDVPLVADQLYCGYVP